MESFYLQFWNGNNTSIPLLASFILICLLPVVSNAQPIAVTPENIPPPSSWPPPPVLRTCPNGSVPVTMTPDIMDVHSRHTTDRGKVRWGNLRVSTAGWYHLYDSHVSESGTLQQNEHGFITIPNASNPEGKPHWNNCGDYWAVADADNSGPSTALQYMGTFWLDAGDNPLGVANLCPFIRAGYCTEYETTNHQFSTCDAWQRNAWVWTNSIHLEAPTVCAVPSSLGGAPQSPAAFQNPVHMSENFDSYAVGASPTQWVDTTDGFPFPRVDDSLFNVRVYRGEWVFGTEHNGPHSYSTFDLSGDKLWDSIYWRGYVYTGRFMYTGANGGAGVTFFADQSESNYHYGLKSDPSDRNFHFWARGTSITGGTLSTGIAAAPGTWYHFKIEVEDAITRTSFRAKVWEDGQPEPNNWQADAYDDGLSRVSVGSVGIWGGNNLPGSKNYDDLNVTPGNARP